MCRVAVLLLLLLLLKGALVCKRPCCCPIERCVPAGASVFVACPSPPTTPDIEVSFSLYKDEVQHATYFFEEANHNLSQLLAGLGPQGTTGPRVEMHINYSLGAEQMRFAIPGVTAGDDGLYRCEAKKLHPGAVEMFCNGNTMNLKVQGIQCQDPQPQPQPQTLLGMGIAVWMGVVGVLFLYALLMTVVASVKMVKMKKKDFSDNVYMNGKCKKTKE